MEATKNHWLAAIREAQREQQRRIRDTLEHGVAKTGELVQGRIDAIKANKEELLRTGTRSIATGGTAFAVSLARGYAGDDALKLGPVPAGLLLGVGAHVASAVFLPGTPAATVAHGVADGLIAASAAQLGREIGARWRLERAARAAPQPPVQGAAAGGAPQVVYALPPGYAPVALPAYAGAGAAPNAADRAMAEAIAVMQEHEQLHAA